MFRMTMKFHAPEAVALPGASAFSEAPAPESGQGQLSSDGR